MSNEPEYVKQLRELYKAYTGKELEAALGVTTRSIQNYIKETERTTPSNPTINKIREVFAKHTKGGQLEINNPGPMSQDYKDKYISLLERNQKLEEKLDSIQSNLKEIPDSMGLLTDLILKGQESVAQKVNADLLQMMAVIEKVLVSKPSPAPSKKQVQKGKH